MPVGRSGFFFFLPNFNFLKLECTGGKVLFEDGLVVLCKMPKALYV